MWVCENSSSKVIRFFIKNCDIMASGIVFPVDYAESFTEPSNPYIKIVRVYKGCNGDLVRKLSFKKNPNFVPPRVVTKESLYKYGTSVHDCGCLSFEFRREPCKHMKFLRETIEEKFD